MQEAIAEEMAEKQRRKTPSQGQGSSLPAQQLELPNRGSAAQPSASAEDGIKPVSRDGETEIGDAAVPTNPKAMGLSDVFSCYKA